MHSNSKFAIKQRKAKERFIQKYGLDKWQEKNRERERKLRARYKYKIERILGKKCVICNSDKKKILYHEIHGKPHHSHYITYILKHIEDFVAICYNCHKTLHHYMKYKEKFDKYLSLLINGPSKRSANQ